ncbi:type VII secretion protein EssB/YukC [Priestia megaterium]
MLKDVNTAFQKEIMMSDDELKITIKPTSEIQPFTALRGKEEQQKWLFADQLIKQVKQHSFSRLHLLICPENIIFDKSLSPAFYIMESKKVYLLMSLTGTKFSRVKGYDSSGR